MKRKERKLVIGSFRRIGKMGSYEHYFVANIGKYEICLESCLNGYDVAIYEDKELVGEKTCTNINNMQEMEIMSGFSLGTREALSKAIEIANKKISTLKS